LAEQRCPLCNASHLEQHIRANTVYGALNGDQKFWQCDKCGVVYLYPSTTKQEEDHFYSVEFEKYMSKRASAERDWSGALEHIRSNQDNVERRSKFLKEHLHSGCKVLEVGCSSGFMLNFSEIVDWKLQE